MEDNRTIGAFSDWSRQGCLGAVVLIACSSSTDVRARGYRCLAITTPIDRAPHLLTSVVSLDRGRLPTVLTAALGTNPPFPNLARASDGSTEAIALRRAETSPPLGYSSAHSLGRPLQASSLPTQRRTRLYTVYLRRRGIPASTNQKWPLLSYCPPLSSQGVAPRWDATVVPEA
ncbi:uncharacterized protein PSFLO_01104 [Pseudozyma flocculosa]|uniref:Uncharacterized protein n=1 Tax=Pseudozyma flocculosa TaxID=84751 RepID=A0A5C3ETE7_9BASI|nr:uncharacterized protein PSFLO_01104 [Pseudozyma flocculosa]